MSTDALFPFAGDHAIQNVAFILEWPTPLTANDLLKVRGLHTELQSSFPTANEMRSVTINFAANPSGHPVSTNSNEIGGVHFLGPQMTPGVVPRMIQVSPLNCIVIINDYTRWGKVWADVQKWLNIIAPCVLLSGHPIPLIGLQYTDVFHWRDNPETLDLSEIFAQETEFLPKNVFNLKSLWHAHHGYIEDRTTPISHRLLENINVGLTENNGQRSISILTVHKATLSTSIWKPDELSDIMIQLMPDLHSRNKKILNTLLSAEVCSKIKLVV